jgi:AcrR family transcriptional regulator
VGHREELLAGAKRCLYEKGYARTTARDIVAASGTNLASIGYHYGSKEALLNAALIEAIGEFGEELERALAADIRPDAGPLERFERFWTQVIESFAVHRPLWAAIFEVFGQIERVPEVRRVFADAIQEAREGWALLFQGIDAAVEEKPAQAVGSFYQALVTGVLAQWLIDPQRAPSGRDLADALRAIVADHVQHGEITQPSAGPISQEQELDRGSASAGT